MIKYNKSTVVSFLSATVSWFCVRHTSKRWFFNIVQVIMKHVPFDAIIHVGIHVDFTSILYSLSPLVPQYFRVKWPWTAPPFPPMRVLEVQWSHAFNVKWPLYLCWLYISSDKVSGRDNGLMLGSKPSVCFIGKESDSLLTQLQKLLSVGNFHLPLFFVVDLGRKPKNGDWSLLVH
jgi:hypothetical protein